MIKRFIIAFVLVVVVCGGLIGFNIFRDGAIKQFFATMKRPAVTVSATDVTPVVWTPGIEAVGTVHAAQGVDVAVEVAGIVKEIKFTANEKVTGGEVLVQLDDAIERADLLTSETALKVAQFALDRAQALVKKGVNSEVTTENAESLTDAAKSRLAKLQATLDQKAVKAPFSGTIGIPRIDVGQYVQPGTVIATLQDLETMKVDFTVPEQLLGKLSIGQPAHFGLSEADMKFSGKILGIDPKIDPNTRLVSVRATLGNPSGELRPGQFIRVRVELPAEPDVIAMPQTAVVSSLYGDYVFIVDQEEAAKPAAGTPVTGEAQAAPAPQLIARQVFVKTGRRNDGMIEIVEGLKPGERVVTAGQNKVSAGTPLNVDNTIDPTKVGNGDQPGA